MVLTGDLKSPHAWLSEAVQVTQLGSLQVLVETWWPLDSHLPPCGITVTELAPSPSQMEQVPFLHRRADVFQFIDLLARKYR